MEHSGFAQTVVKRGRCEPMPESLVRVDDHLCADVVFFDDIRPDVLGGGAEREKVRRAAVWQDQAEIDRAAFAVARKAKRGRSVQIGRIEKHHLLDLNAVKAVGFVAVFRLLFLES